MFRATDRRGVLLVASGLMMVMLLASRAAFIDRLSDDLVGQAPRGSTRIRTYGA